jgi:hypothetical protein
LYNDCETPTFTPTVSDLGYYGPNNADVPFIVEDVNTLHAVKDYVSKCQPSLTLVQYTHYIPKAYAGFEALDSTPTEKRPNNPSSQALLTMFLDHLNPVITRVRQIAEKRRLGPSLARKLPVVFTLSLAVVWGAPLAVSQGTCAPLFLRCPITEGKASKIDAIVDRIVPKKYRYCVIHYSVLYQVPPHLIAAEIDQETNGEWNPFVVSKLNANGTRDIGLAQANNRYLTYYKYRFGLNDPKNAEQAIAFCCKYTRYLYDNTGTWIQALMAYKCGLTGRPTLKVVQDAIRLLIKIDYENTL